MNGALHSRTRKSIKPQIQPVFSLSQIQRDPKLNPFWPYIQTYIHIFSQLTPTLSPQNSILDQSFLPLFLTSALREELAIPFPLIKIFYSRFFANLQQSKILSTNALFLDNDFSNLASQMNQSNTEESSMPSTIFFSPQEGQSVEAESVADLVLFQVLGAYGEMEPEKKMKDLISKALVFEAEMFERLNKVLGSKAKHSSEKDLAVLQVFVLFFYSGLKSYSFKIKDVERMMQYLERVIEFFIKVFGKDPGVLALSAIDFLKATIRTIAFIVDLKYEILYYDFCILKIFSVVY